MKIKIPSSSGLKLSAVLNQPKQKSSKLAILMPGFLDSKDYPHLKQLAIDLANQDYYVIRFDPMGVWDSQGNISEYSVTQYLKDLMNVIKFSKEKYPVNQIVLIGHSLGGMIALLYAALNKGDVHTVIGIMPPPSQTRPKGFKKNLEIWKKNKQKISTRPFPNNSKKERQFIVPYEYIRDSKKYNLLKLIKKIKKPFLLIAGELDDKVTPAEVKQIFKAANQPKNLIVLKNVIHDYRFYKTQIKSVNRKIIQFLEKIDI